MKSNERTPLLKHLLRRLSLHGDLDLPAAAVDIRKNIHFRGPNTFILAMAIIIASVGLNVNSIPVIIGAMLISPLMGPILGLGLALGTNDYALMRESLKNLAVMVVISIVASTLYFLLSPLKLENPSELLARTNPTIYDVLIATFSGLAGILETCRKDKGTVIAGVAIATALMPPLCTIGYGIATWHLHYAAGALYLFFINSVFIAFATFAGVKYLGFEQVAELDKEASRRNHRRVFVFIVLMIIPSIFSAVRMIQQNNFDRNVDAFVKECQVLNLNSFYDHRTSHEVRPSTVELFLVEELDEAAKESVLAIAERHNIVRSQVVFNGQMAASALRNEEWFEDLRRREEAQMAYKDSVIAAQQREIGQFRERELRYMEIMSQALGEKKSK